jgi:hypothetical protein
MQTNNLEKLNYITKINMNLIEAQKLIHDQIKKIEPMSR